MTITRADRQPFHSRESMTQKKRSRLRSRGRLCGRVATANCCLRARFSQARSRNASSLDRKTSRRFWSSAMGAATISPGAKCQCWAPERGSCGRQVALLTRHGIAPGLEGSLCGKAGLEDQESENDQGDSEDMAHGEVLSLLGQTRNIRRSYARGPRCTRRDTPRLPIPFGYIPLSSSATTLGPAALALSPTPTRRPALLPPAPPSPAVAQTDCRAARL